MTPPLPLYRSGLSLASFVPYKRYKLLVLCCCLISKSCPFFCDRVNCSPPGSSVHGFPKQEYWSGLPFPPPDGLPNPGIKSNLFHWQADSFTAEPPGKPTNFLHCLNSGTQSLVPLAASCFFYVVFFCMRCN